MSFNHKMLELARNSRGITQTKLSSELSSFDQSNLSRLERGEFQASGETLQMIANVLDFPLEFFYQNELRTPLSNIYFRKRSTIPKKDFNIILAEVKILLKSIDYLLEQIEITEYPKLAFDLNEGFTPEDVAGKAREILKVPSGPIREPVKYLEEIGIIVYFYDSPSEKFDGLTGYTDNGYPVIFVNSNMPNDRIRFSLAHEFAHLLIHIPGVLEPWRDEEAEANNFVGEFYMPDIDSRYDLQSLTFKKLITMKAYWGLSKASLIYEARRRKYISESTFKYMMIELGRRKERKSESGFVYLDSPTLLTEVIDLLRSDLGYSDSDIASKLHLNLTDYHRFFDLLNGSKSKIRHLHPLI